MMNREVVEFLYKQKKDMADRKIDLLRKEFRECYAQHRLPALVSSIMDLQRMVAEIGAVEEVLEIPICKRWVCNLNY